MSISAEEALQRLTQAAAALGKAVAPGDRVHLAAGHRFRDDVEFTESRSHLWITEIDGPNGFGVAMRYDNPVVSYGNKPGWGETAR